MTLQREFQGKIAKRTMRIGENIAVQFQNGQKDQPSERILVPLADYLAGVKTTYFSSDKRHSQTNVT